LFVVTRRATTPPHRTQVLLVLGSPKHITMEGLLGVDEFEENNICANAALCSSVRCLASLCAYNALQFHGVLCKWLATFDCLSMFDEHQIPSSGKFGISNVASILSVITLSSGLTTVLVFVEENEDEEDVTGAKPLGHEIVPIVSRFA
jgi:hypothetical protein